MKASVVQQKNNTKHSENMHREYKIQLITILWSHYGFSLLLGWELNSFNFQRFKFQVIKNEKKFIEKSRKYFFYLKITQVSSSRLKKTTLFQLLIKLNLHINDVNNSNLTIVIRRLQKTIAHFTTQIQTEKLSQKNNFTRVGSRKKLIFNSLKWVFWNSSTLSSFKSRLKTDLKSVAVIVIMEVALKIES